MSNDLQPDGVLYINGTRHQVEYEPGGMTGLGTAYIRVKGAPNAVPIYRDQINEVCDLLQRAKRVIEAAENCEDSNNG